MDLFDSVFIFIIRISTSSRQPLLRRRRPTLIRITVTRTMAGITMGIHTMAAIITATRTPSRRRRSRSRTRMTGKWTQRRTSPSMLRRFCYWFGL